MIVTLLTDFGDRDAYVGVLKGIVIAGAPGARIVDLTHAIRPQDVYGAAYVLETAYTWFPAETVHVAVVDPGVGSDRAILAVRTARGRFLAPDNGLLTPVFLADTLLESVRVEPNIGRVASATFHGRDVFAPAAAALASGRPLRDLGPATDPSVVLPDYRATPDGAGGVSGRVLHVDRFGNAISSILRADVADLGDEAEVRVLDRSVGRPERTYSDVAPGAPMALFGSSDHLEIAVRNGNAARTLGLAAGDRVVVRRRESKR